MMLGNYFVLSRNLRKSVCLNEVLLYIIFYTQSQVIVVTHHYGGRKGVRYLSSLLKVSFSIGTVDYVSSWQKKVNFNFKLCFIE